MSIEQTATVNEAHIIAIYVPELPQGAKVKVSIETDAVQTDFNLASIVGAAKRTTRGKGSFNSVEEVDLFINDFRGERE